MWLLRIAKHAEAQVGHPGGGFSGPCILFAQLQKLPPAFFQGKVLGPPPHHHHKESNGCSFQGGGSGQLFEMMCKQSPLTILVLRPGIAPEKSCFLALPTPLHEKCFSKLASLFQGSCATGWLAWGFYLRCTPSIGFGWPKGVT